MGELAARTIFSNDTGPLAGTGLDTLAKNQGAILELEGAQTPQSKKITDGSISPTAAYVIVDTEGSAAADDLSVINPVLSISENLHDGMIVYLRAADSGRVVTVKNTSSANGINTYDGKDYVLSPTHWLKLQLRSGKWYEVEGRAMETALAAATAAAAASTPATTTSRGIGRVATSDDLVDGATISNGPAFLAAGVHTSVAAAAGKVPVADADGSLNSWAGARYAACSTAAATAAKSADLANFQLVKGSSVFVTFANANTATGALTLNVNGTGAKTVYNERGVTSSSNIATWLTGVPIEFVYDGTYWRYKTVDAVGNAIGFYFYARDEKPSGTQGGATSSYSWHTRDLNTVNFNSIIGVNLANNQVTLPAGSYLIYGKTPSYAADNVRAAIYSITSSTYLSYGTTSRGSSTGVPTDSEVFGVVTLLAPSVLELRMWARSAFSSGLGYVMSDGNIAGVPEIYSELHIWKM